MAIADMIKTTLGPKGMVCRYCTCTYPYSPPTTNQDKILQSLGRGQEVSVTNDGATILKSVYVDNPAAKVLVGVLSRCH